MKVVLVGAGGYGAGYALELLDSKTEDVVFAGVVDPFLNNSLAKERILEAGIPVFDTLEAFYEKNQADLAVIATPTYLHCQQCVTALSSGSDVLCEKPAASTVAQTEQMIDAEKKSGRFLAIGYQWSFSDAILELKRDILNGDLGAPVFLKTAISWPRNRAYYARGGGWAGKLYKDGQPIFDSIAANACAHYLHNMLFILGKDMSRSARPVSVTGDFFRANPIESFDTCTMKIHTDEGAELYFAASHAASKVRNPIFHYKFEKCDVFFEQGTTSLITAHFQDGRVKNYGNPFHNPLRKLWTSINAVKEKASPICGIQAASMHVKLIELIHKNYKGIDFERNLIREMDGEDRVYIEGLYENLYAAYEEGKTFSEMGFYKNH